MKGVYSEKNIELDGEEMVEQKENVGEQHGMEEGGGEEAELCPQLPEGFYQVEAVQRKRVRKGVPQYYIKWRGWPESANTWEPLENLEMCLDIVDAFEESSREGKQRSPQKRKNSTGCPVRQAKKKQHGTAAMASPVVARQTRSARKRVAQPLGVQVESDLMTTQRTENQPSDDMQQAESDSTTQEKVENQLCEDMQHVRSHSGTPQRAENQKSDEAQPVLCDLATPRRAKSQPSEDMLPVQTDLPIWRRVDKRPKQKAQPVIIDLEADEQAQLVETDWAPSQGAEEQSAKRKKLGPADRERIEKVLKHSWMEVIRDNWGWGEDQKIKLQLPLTDPASQYIVGKLGVMSLAPGKCVNSEIIEAYRILLRNREQRLNKEGKAKGSRSYFFMPPWFMVEAGKYAESYASRKKKDKLQLEEETKSMESFFRCYMRQVEGPTVAEADSILFPCNVRKNHWVLFVWSVADWNVQVLDSINDRRKNTSLTRKYNYDKVCIIEKMIPDILSYCNPSGRYPKRFPKCNLVEKRPTQLNKFDCGVMVCMYMGLIVQGYDLAEVSFNQDEIDNFRYWIANDIQNGQASDISQF